MEQRKIPQSQNVTLWPKDVILGWSWEYYRRWQQEPQTENIQNATAWTEMTTKRFEQMRKEYEQPNAVMPPPAQYALISLAEVKTYNAQQIQDERHRAIQEGFHPKPEPVEEPGSLTLAADKFPGPPLEPKPVDRAPTDLEILLGLHNKFQAMEAEATRLAAENVTLKETLVEQQGTIDRLMDAEAFLHAKLKDHRSGLLADPLLQKQLRELLQAAPELPVDNIGMWPLFRSTLVLILQKLTGQNPEPPIEAEIVSEPVRVEYTNTSADEEAAPLVAPTRGRGRPHTIERAGKQAEAIRMRGLGWNREQIADELNSQIKAENICDDNGKLYVITAGRVRHFFDALREGRVPGFTHTEE